MTDITPEAARALLARADAWPRPNLPSEASEFVDALSNALEALLDATPEPPTTDDREALARTMLANRYGYTPEFLDEMRDERNNVWRLFEALADAILAAGFRRPSPPTDEPEWEYAVLNGLGHALYSAPTLQEAIRDIARDQSGPGTKPKRSIMRRRKAGPWEPVEAAARVGGGEER